MNRKKRLYLNMFTSVIGQLIAIICGFILPKCILSAYGSDVNGLITSITRFLGAITFLEMGIGPVIQSNLYRPLAEKNDEQISKILVSTQKFYRKIAYIFLIYILILILIFPIINLEYDKIYTISLLVIIAISSFFQYYFGLTYQIFLSADQKIYIGQIIFIITMIFNTMMSIILIKIGYSIHIVKLTTSIIFLLRPIILRMYVKKNYKINWNIQFNGEPIKQKWSGFSQHLAAVVCGEIDVILLTIFGTYQMVSIYSTYFLVVSGLTNLVMTCASGLESYWGDMYAKQEITLLKKSFEIVETFIHMGIVFIFTCTACLITPFVNVYVFGLKDSSAYSLPIFGILLTFAYAAQCLRIPYFRIIKSAGHYKETQMGAFISMIINVLISIILVIKSNNKLEGVAIGTLIAMIFHTTYFALYLKKNIIQRRFIFYIKHMFIDSVIVILSLISCNFFQLKDISYKSWILLACKCSIIILGLIMLFGLIFYKKDVISILKKLNKK